MSNAALLALTIFAAGSTRPALEALKPALEKAAGRPVEIRYGATGTLARHLENGAAADLFFAADAATPRGLSANGVLDATTVVPYARGRLVLLVSKDVAFELPKELSFATASAFEKLPLTGIGAASPSVSPYGRATNDVLAATRLGKPLKPRMVLAPSVDEVVAYVRKGNVDVAFGPASAAFPRDAADALRFVPIEESLYAPIRHVAAVVASSSSKDAAKKALAAATSPEARKVWERFGFAPPDEAPARPPAAATR